MSQSRNSITWENFPGLIRTQIFSYLSAADRVNASLVCRTWAQDFQRPQLWRSMVCGFYCIASEDTPLRTPCVASYNDQKAIWFAAKYGQYVTNLTVVCQREKDHGSGQTQKNLRDFLQILEDKCCLHRLSFYNFRLHSSWGSSRSRGGIITAVIHFLKYQKNLQVIALSHFELPENRGLDLLHGLSKSSLPGLRQLDIDYFFAPPTDICMNSTYCIIMSKFCQLHYITLNYSMIDGDVLLSLAKNGNLESIRIKSDDKDPHSHNIPSEKWKIAKVLCPNLQVHYELKNIPMFEELQLLFSRDMPLLSLIFFTGDKFEEECSWHLPLFIKHLTACYSNILEKLVVNIWGNMESLDDQLLQLVRSCTSLKYLEITAHLTNTNTLQELCKLQLSKKLLKLHVDLWGNNFEKVGKLEEVLERHNKQIHQTELDFDYFLYDRE